MQAILTTHDELQSDYNMLEAQLTDLTVLELAAYLADRKNAAVINCLTSVVAVFPSAGDTGWYTQELPLEDPNDAEPADTPIEAIEAIDAEYGLEIYV